MDDSLEWSGPPADTTAPRMRPALPLPTEPVQAPTPPDAISSANRYRVPDRDVDASSLEAIEAYEDCVENIECAISCFLSNSRARPDALTHREARRLLEGLLKEARRADPRALYRPLLEQGE